MKSTYLVAVGGLMIVLGALFGIMTLLDERAFDAPILGVISVPAVLGLLLVMLAFCPSCQAAVVCKAAQEPVVLRGASATQFISALPRLPHSRVD